MREKYFIVLDDQLMLHFSTRSCFCYHPLISPSKSIFVVSSIPGVFKNFIFLPFKSYEHTSTYTPAIHSSVVSFHTSQGSFRSSEGDALYSGTHLTILQMKFMKALLSVLSEFFSDCSQDNFESQTQILDCHSRHFSDEIVLTHRFS